MSEKSSTFAAAKVKEAIYGTDFNGFTVGIIDDIGSVYADDQYHGGRLYRQGDQ
jgi:hypothetical protein